jgi:hypothetical protein
MGSFRASRVIRPDLALFGALEITPRRLGSFRQRPGSLALFGAMGVDPPCRVRWLCSALPGSPTLVIGFVRRDGHRASESGLFGRPDRDHTSSSRIAKEPASAKGRTLIIDPEPPGVLTISAFESAPDPLSASNGDQLRNLKKNELTPDFPKPIASSMIFKTK